MTTITLRNTKGTPLTNTELDANFTNLNTDKAELTNPVFINSASSRKFLVNAEGTPSSNLGDPSIAEMALFDPQFNNKTEFYDIANMFVETSTDGTTWSTYSVTDAQKRTLIGGDYNANIVIPYNTAYFRIRFRANAYVYLNALYAYFSSNGHTTKVQIYKKHDSGTYTQHTSSNTAVTSWPGHLYLPFSTVPFHSAGTLGTHYHEVSVVFIPVWNATYSANNISLDKLQIWGGYPAGKRNLYTTDELANAVFPANVSVVALRTSGNVGIGTSSPVTTLDVSATGGMIRIAGASGNNLIQTSTGTAGLGLWSGGNQFLYSTAGINFLINATVGTAAPTGGSTALILDTSGNLGLGVTPSAWNTSFKALEYSAGYVAAISTSELDIGQNNFYSSSLGNWAYKTTAGATQYRQTGSEHRWYNAPSGTAGAATTFTQAMTLDANGNFGLGTTSIGGSANDRQITVAGTNSAQASFTTNSVVTNSIGTTTALGYIGTTTNHPFIFTTNNTEKMRLDSSGKLGIGTSSPLANLQVGTSSALTNYQGASVGIILPSGSGSWLELAENTVNGTSFRISKDASTGVSINTNSKDLGFKTNAYDTTVASAQMVLKISGNVGIGTSTPAALLDVSNAGSIYISNKTAAPVNSQSTPGSLVLTGTGWNTVLGSQPITGSIGLAAVYGALNAGSTEPAMTFSLLGTGSGGFNTTAGPTTLTEYMRITNYGNVGIGTTSPSYKLTVAGTSPTVVALDTGVNTTRAYVSATNSQVSFGATYSGSGVPIVFGLGLASGIPAVEFMRLDTSGNLGIGVTPTTRLDIAMPAGAGTPRARVDQISDNPYYELQRWSGTASNYVGTRIRNVQGAIAFDQSNVTTIGAQTFTQAMTLDASGNLGIGTTTPSYKLQVVGSFAATTKSFVIDHPTRPGMKLRYGSLEGPENGVYVRGRLKGNKIELPEYWTKLVDADSITVNLTPVGKHQDLYVVDVSNNTITVGNGNILDKSINCFYTVFAERVDVDKLVVEIG